MVQLACRHVIGREREHAIPDDARKHSDADDDDRCHDFLIAW
jgi:hypothetical protein